MAREIRGIRRASPGSDGDTIHVSDFKVFRNGKEFKLKFKKKSLTAKGRLKVRVLGVDAPELHYPGPDKCPVGAVRLTGKDRPKIPPQDPWGTTAKQWLDQKLPDGAKVIVELDSEAFDRFGRVLGYLWTVKGNWQRNALLNALLVENGHAFPYQIWPNLTRFREIKQAAQAAMSPPKGVFAAHSKKLLSLKDVAARKGVNEPFLYRKVVDGAICQVPPRSLLTRFVGDARTWLYYRPTQYAKVPIEYRIFFDSKDVAVNAGFFPA